MESSHDHSPPAPGTPYGDPLLDKILKSIRDLDHPRQIGAFVIKKVIGEGGMGIVYEAEQTDPIRRTVAIKIVKLGMDTRDVIARFESERQALAMMNHPNVAKVLDAGATETGRPYFVMEFVDGEPITQFCDNHCLTLNQRMELLIQACDAVQHAHQKAIIHRDLKPSNILVEVREGRPCVKVIDFGVAKALSKHLTEKTLFTETGQLLGTPEYMAPEQADSGAVDIDTRSDVYSLGVVLYELLSGALPFDATSLRSGGYQSIQQIIRDVEPPRPGTRLSGLGNHAREVARLRHAPLNLLEKELQGELAWIPLKAMRKDRSQRYATATELAEDIQNYLAQRPLRAGPESALYRTRKFVRRNKGGVAAVVAMVCLLLGGIATTSWQSARARRAEKEARSALDEATNANAGQQAVIDFLTQDLLWSAEPARSHGREMTVREAVDLAARDVDSRFPGRPLVEASVRTALAGTYDKLGRADLGMPQADAANQIIRQMHHEGAVDGLSTTEVLGELLDSQGKLVEAEQVIRQTLDGRRRLLGMDHPDSLTTQLILGRILLERGDYAEADALDRDALDRSRRAQDRDNSTALAALGSLSSLLKAQGKIVESEKSAREAVALSRRIYGDDHLQTIANVERHARLLWRLGNSKEAEPLLRKVVADRARIQGAEHPDVLLAQDTLASYLAESGHVDDAIKLESGVVRTARRVLGNDHPLTFSIINNFGRFRQQQGELKESEALCREAVAGDERVLGAEHLETLTVKLNLAYLLNQMGSSAEAEVLLRQVIDSQRKVLGNQHPVTLAGINNLGGMLFERHRFADAEPLFREALAGRRKIYGDLHIETLGAVSNLGRTLEAEDRLADAEPLFSELYQNSQTAQINPRQAALFISHWGETLARMGKYREAEAPLLEACKRLKETKQAHTEYMDRMLKALASVYQHTDRPAEATSCREESAELEATTRPATTSSTIQPTSRTAS